MLLRQSNFLKNSINSKIDYQIYFTYVFKKILKSEVDPLISQ